MIFFRKKNKQTKCPRSKIRLTYARFKRKHIEKERVDDVSTNFAKIETLALAKYFKRNSNKGIVEQTMISYCWS